MDHAASVPSFRSSQLRCVCNLTSEALSLLLAGCKHLQSMQLDWLCGMMWGMDPSLFPSISPLKKMVSPAWGCLILKLCVKYILVSVNIG